MVKKTKLMEITSKKSVIMGNTVKICQIIALFAIFDTIFSACPEPENSVSELPALTGTVSITETAQVGQTLTVNTSTLGSSGIITYQWKRGTTNIGTNSNTYTIRTVDAGSTITIMMTRSGNSGSITSNPTAVITSNIIEFV